MSLSKSKDRGNWSRTVLMKKIDDGTLTEKAAIEKLEIINMFDAQRAEYENSDDFKIDNLEYDLRTTEWILSKARSHKYYAQNLYAAMCNNEFTKNEVWPLLQHKTWSCTWRTAGGIIANMRQEGDYIDWYCSGIRDEPVLEDEQYQNLSKEAQEHYLERQRYVAESIVTDEIREDLLKLGWVVNTDDSNST